MIVDEKEIIHLEINFNSTKSNRFHAVRVDL